MKVKVSHPYRVILFLIIILAIKGQITSSPTGQPTGQPTSQPSTINPSYVPTRSPTRAPTNKPSLSPTISPTLKPTRSPTLAPTLRPTSPTVSPTYRPTQVPTRSPTSPTLAPTNKPTYKPTLSPTVKPTITPTLTPTHTPTLTPTTYSPTITFSPSYQPTNKPTNKPTYAPTSTPTASPTVSQQPSYTPSRKPTARPTNIPTAYPVFILTRRPTSPTLSPTLSPTTIQPSYKPTLKPTSRPSGTPTSQPTAYPTYVTAEPSTAQPSVSQYPTIFVPDVPTGGPTYEPTTTDFPTYNPSLRPTRSPTAAISAAPSGKYAIANITGQVTFDPIYPGLCNDIEIKIDFVVNYAINYHDPIRLHTYGLTSGPCTLPNPGMNLPLVVSNSSEFTANYVEGNITYGLHDSYIELYVELLDGLLPYESYSITIDRSNGLKRSCTKDYTIWGYSIGNCNLLRHCKNFDFLGNLTVTSPFQYDYPMTSGCFAYNSSLFFTPPLPAAGITVNIALYFPFFLEAYSQIYVYLPGFTNRLSNMNMTSGAIEVTSDGYSLYLTNRSNVFTNGIQWNTDYKWIIQWIEGEKVNDYSESYLILTPQPRQYNPFIIQSTNISNIWISINQYPNALSSIYGRFANDSHFTYELKPPSYSSNHYYINKTSFLFSNTLGMGCDSFKNCNNHGKCNAYDGTCNCFLGYGSQIDLDHAVSQDFLPDCSSQACPIGRAIDMYIPSYTDNQGYTTTSTGTAPYRPYVECSNRGKCDRKVGKCICNEGFEGHVCERTICPGSPPCGDRGRCMTRKQLMIYAQTQTTSIYDYLNTEPYNNITFYNNFDGHTQCVCDSSWLVGLGPNQTQQSEYFGVSCELRHCPSGDNPQTPNIDETNCTNIELFPGGPRGLLGNKCHVDCSNNGICDYTIGVCNCFDGYWGPNCGLKYTLR